MPSTPPTTEFVRLWTSYGQRIYGYVLALTSNYADADEIYQEVGMTLWEKFDQFTPGTSFQAWARQVALYKVRNFQRLQHHHDGRYHAGDDPQLRDQPGSGGSGRHVDRRL
ncbi:MAG: hypothetical protein JW818_11685 [Pirellulales bacterium]|nr:hypothetical protein [Pirellulales bacterium]